MRKLIFVTSLLATMQVQEPLLAQLVASANRITKSTANQKAYTKLLKTTLTELEQKYQVSFMYKTELIQLTIAVDPGKSFQSVEAELEALLKPNGLTYKKVRDNFYVITQIGPKAEKDLQKLESRLSGSIELGPITPSSVSIPTFVNPAQKSVVDVTVSGTITDESGVALPGVTVLVKGTQNGTTTDPSGRFSLNVAEPNISLVVSFIGYTSQEIALNGRTSLTIRLAPDTKALQEVVVVGYGTQVRREVTGAVSTIKGSAIAQAPVPSFDAALQGRAAGVQVSQAGGATSGAVRIQIRGTSSVSSGTEPLYIIDGMPIYQDVTGIAGGRTSTILNPMVNINPSDIESIEVLKDAAATAIYGSRGANGVILVTTKTGKKGQSKTTVDYNRGVSNATNLVEYANGSQWLGLVDEARKNSVGFGIAAGQEKFDPLTLSSNNLPTPTGISGPQYGANTAFTRAIAEQTNTDWRDFIVQQGNMQEFNVSTSNGFEKGAFFISGQYRDEAGIIINDRLKRYSARANIDFNPTDRLRTGAKITFSYLDKNNAEFGIGGNGGGIGRQNFGATGGWGQANTGALPIMPVYNPDGTYFDPLRGRNIAAGVDPNNFNNRTEQNRTIGTAFLEYTLLKGLILHAEAAADFMTTQTIHWTSDVIRYNRVGEEVGRYLKNRNFNGYASYNTQFGANHSLSVTAGSEVQKSVIRRQDYAFEGLQGAQMEIGEIGNNTNFITAVSGIFGDSYLLSYFSRANYTFKGKYLAGLSFRRDGSSAFGPNNRFGNFPAASLGWIVSDESFFSPFANTVNLLKLRTSYGRTGNNGIRNFAFLNGYATWPVYGVSPGYGFSVLANPDIKWEHNDQFDAAIEFGLLNNRISGSVGYYNKVSKGMLLNVPVAPNIGIGTGGVSIITNIGDLRNSGIELQLSSTNLDTRGFRWTTDFNITTNKNEVLQLTNQLAALPAGNSFNSNGIMQSGATITKQGGRLGAFYLADYAGLDKQGFETIYALDVKTLRETGNTVRLQNKAGGDSTLRATTTNINNNRFVFNDKTGLPTLFGGLNNTFSYKGIELSALFTFQGGNYIYDALEENNSYVRTGGNVIRAEVIGNTWSESNPNAKYPRPTWNVRDNNVNAAGVAAPQTLGTRTSRFLYKGDFIRLKTLQIAYSLPTALTKRVALQNVRIYGNAQNLLTFTKYPGFDPELLVLGGFQDRNLSQGFLNSTPVPQVRVFNTGLSVTF